MSRVANDRTQTPAAASQEAVGRPRRVVPEEDLTAWSRLGRGVARRAQLASIATLLVIIEVLGQLEVHRIIVPFSEVLVRLYELAGGGLAGDLLLSLRGYAIGFGLALVSGLAVAIATSFSPALDEFVEPYINAGLATPTTALIPVLMIVFGLGFATRVAVIFLYGFFMIVVNTQAGLRSVSPSLVDMGRAFGASGWKFLLKITIPSALPLILTGIRVTISRCLKGMVNAETVLSITGLGALIIRFGRTFDVASLYAIILVVIVIAVSMTSFVGALERKSLRWGG